MFLFCCLLRSHQISLKILYLCNLLLVIISSNKNIRYNSIVTIPVCWLWQEHYHHCLTLNFLKFALPSHIIGLTGLRIPISSLFTGVTYRSLNADKEWILMWVERANYSGDITIWNFTASTSSCIISMHQKSKVKNGFLIFKSFSEISCC